MQKLIVTLTAILAFCGIAAAQTTAMSPYSRYGYGSLSDNASAAQRQMGSVGYAMNSGRQINVMNPASYAMMDSLTFLFDMGVDFTILKSNENGTRETNYGGGLDYITMQVPIIKGLGASVGLLPYGSTGYSFGSAIKNGHASREGDGSLNQLYLGVGGSPFRGFALGLNFAYLFGTVTNDLYTTTDQGYSTLFGRKMTVRDWRMDIGVQYGFNISRRDRITLGVTYSPKKDLHGHVYGIYYNTAASNIVPDTVNLGDTKMRGRYSVPETWGAGINWNHANRIMAEVDFTYQPWSKAKYGSIESFESTQFADRYRIAAGLQYTPALRGGYFRRINYRLGGYYNRDYIMIDGNNIKEYSLTAGFGFPVPSFKTIVNLGFEYRHRQGTPNPLIKENYFNITLGINFNEMWFQKNKIY